MQKDVIIVGAGKSFSEWPDRLCSLIGERNIKVEQWTLKDYKKFASSPIDGLFPNKMYIFVGTDLLGKPIEPSVSDWKYEQFGCRIGWNGNKCVIYASATDLPYSDYDKFRDHCKYLFADYPDVIIPPKSHIVGVVDNVKGFVGKKNSNSVFRAQYSVIIHEFVDKLLDDFFNNEYNSPESSDGTNSIASLGVKLDNSKSKAQKNMSAAQVGSCHAIIHTAAVACSAVAFIPIPFADAVPITGTQVAMVIALGKVFGNKLTKYDARIILKTAAAPIAGRMAAKAGLNFVPVIGWTINSAIACIITEILGWTIANDFATKTKS